MFFWILLGVAIGYFFKKQIDVGIGKALARLRKSKFLKNDEKY